MEYVILRAAHPSWLSLQLPAEVRELIQYDAKEVRDLRTPGRGIAFLARGPGIVRVVASYRAHEILAVETVRNRYISPAHLTEKGLFNVPTAVARHLGLQVQTREDGRARYTADSVIWFLPAPEYYEFRARERTEKGWTGPATGGFAHVYLGRSLMPVSPDLAVLEDRIESEEWRPRAEALQRVTRSRR
jgi:hypothetical protein